MVETDLGGARAVEKGLEMREPGGRAPLGAPVRVVGMTEEAERRRSLVPVVLGFGGQAE